MFYLVLYQQFISIYQYLSVFISIYRFYMGESLFSIFIAFSCRVLHYLTYRNGMTARPALAFYSSYLFKLTALASRLWLNYQKNGCSDEYLV
ncbi:protein of unknown function [Shewanella benthica]|uniref:Uncharacterized protein n=1 Tax=Shewanella benthica TaxID=43661 RepID=A0A330M7I2_9GAMM|nr:protein of unknown function [Shewanella benthica]